MLVEVLAAGHHVLSAPDVAPTFEMKILQGTRPPASSAQCAGSGTTPIRLAFSCRGVLWRGFDEEAAIWWELLSAMGRLHDASVTLLRTPPHRHAAAAGPVRVWFSRAAPCMWLAQAWNEA
ncbi:hypothetical protein [Methylobacterium sp. sgz302541]|uniref:hypothetical protein n=1 Tax=unclassified Methylobacterium TaxID=2615210 RepID=UPI003D32A931